MLMTASLLPRTRFLPGTRLWLSFPSSVSSDSRSGGRGSSINIARFRRRWVIVAFRSAKGRPFAEAKGDNPRLLPQIGRNLSSAPCSAQEQQFEPKKGGLHSPSLSLRGCEDVQSQLRCWRLEQVYRP